MPSENEDSPESPPTSLQVVVHVSQGRQPEAEPTSPLTPGRPFPNDWNVGDVGSLDFDVWRVVATVGARAALPLVATEVFRAQRLLAPQGGSDSEGLVGRAAFRSWIDSVERGYMDKPYHNSVHGCDVMVTAHSYLINSGFLGEAQLARHANGGSSDDLTQQGSNREWQLLHLALVIAGASHDIGHLGVMNPFLKAISHPLALANPGVNGVLEVMHAAVTQRLLNGNSSGSYDYSDASSSSSISSSGTNGSSTSSGSGGLLDQLSVAEARWVRSAVNDLVLATDMSLQRDFLEKWAARRAAAAPLELECHGPDDNANHNRLWLGKLILKAADLSNPTKSVPNYLTWTGRIISEFYCQGDEELRLGLPVTMVPMCNRSTPGLAKDQLGFVTHTVKPTFTALVGFLADRRAAQEANATPASMAGRKPSIRRSKSTGDQLDSAAEGAQEQANNAAATELSRSASADSGATSSNATRATGAVAGTETTGVAAAVTATPAAPVSSAPAENNGALFIRRPSALAALAAAELAPPSSPTPGMLALVDALDATIEYWKSVTEALGPEEHAALRLPSDLPPKFRPEGFPDGYYSGAVYIDEYDSQL